MMRDGQVPPDTGLADDQPGAELRALGQAASQALPAIRQATASGNDGALTAIEAVIILDDAMEQLRALQTAVPALLASARSGTLLEADIKARADELSALEDEVSTTRRELERAQAAEQATRARLAELTALREQIDELRRRERLAAALHGLNEQRQVIEERLILLRQLTERPEEAIAAGAGEVVRLAEDRRALLAPHARDVLAQAGEALRSLEDEEERARAQQELLADARERLAAAQQRQAQLEAERDRSLARLEAHARADRALAAALSSDGLAAASADPLGQLQATLDGIITQLHDVDGALGDMLAASQAGYNAEHDVLTWTD